MAFDPARFTEQARRSWSGVAPQYADLSAAHFAPVTQAFIRFALLKPGQSVLDVACGPGTATLSAAKAVGPDGKAVGVDLSPGMLAVAAARSRPAGLAIDWREGNAEKLDFPDHSFDAVICQLGLMLFPRPALALKEMARVVRPGGLVACLVQGLREKMVFTSLVMGTLLKYAPDMKEEGAPNLYAFAKPGVLEEAFRAAGLKPDKAERLAGTLSFASPEAYWDTMTAASGRTGAVLRALPAETQKAVRAEALEQAARYAAPAGVAIPYEMAMARATS